MNELARNNSGDEQINDDAASPSRDVAIIGESPHGGTQISMQVLQSIYNEITGGTEELNKGYDRPFQIAFSDLEQLNHKFEQVTEQYHIQSKNCSVKLYHLNDTREKFSSFDRFRIYNKSSTSPVESILLKYNFLIVLPKTRKPQSYTISVRLASRITIIKKMRSEKPPYPRPIFRLMGSQTAMVAIHYVDYAVARNFLTLLDGWFDSLTVGSSPRSLKWLRNNSQQIPTATKYGLGGFAIYLLYERLPIYLIPHEPNLLILGKLTLLGFSVIFVAYQFGRFLGRRSEDAIDELLDLSYINLNKGDEKIVQEVKNDSRRTVIKAISSVISAFAVGVAASVIANWITA